MSRKWIAGAGMAVALVAGMTGCANTASTAGQAPQQAGDANGQEVKLMVGGLNKQIYLPFKWPTSWATTRTQA